MDMDVLGAVASKNVSKAMLAGQAEVARHEVKSKKKMAMRVVMKGKRWVFPVLIRKHDCVSDIVTEDSHSSWIDFLNHVWCHYADLLFYAPVFPHYFTESRKKSASKL